MTTVIMESEGSGASARTPGTWRDADGARVEFTMAQRLWADAARQVLLGVALRYHAYITYAELGQAVQDRTGVRTRSLLTNWVGGVLGVVAHECKERREPVLTALCVRQDESVGPGYIKAVEDVYGIVPEDPDQHAAAERLACYKAFGAELPPDGGAPALPRRVRQVREERERARRVELPPATCPTCFMQLPSTGHCDACG
jgi:hypothetical protein